MNARVKVFAETRRVRAKRGDAELCEKKYSENRCNHLENDKHLAEILFVDMSQQEVFREKKAGEKDKAMKEREKK